MEVGSVNMGFLFASENEHVVLKHAHIRKDNYQQHF